MEEDDKASCLTRLGREVFVGQVQLCNLSVSGVLGQKWRPPTRVRKSAAYRSRDVRIDFIDDHETAP